MKFYLLYTLAFLLFLNSCFSPSPPKETDIVSMQIVDRNGFTETISTKERLQGLGKNDFMSAQPYQKVLRVYGKSTLGKSRSLLTTYHPNGQLWQYLELVNGRAHGIFRQWYPDGTIQIDAFLVEGMGDVTEAAQLTWLFDGENSVYDSRGNLVNKFLYSKGNLEGTSISYHPNQQIAKEEFFEANLREGIHRTWDAQGVLREISSYKKGLCHGDCYRFWPSSTLCFKEHYVEGKLEEAVYYSKEGEILSSVKEGNGIKTGFEEDQVSYKMQIQKGEIQGLVERFSSRGNLTNSYYIDKGEKQGIENIFYPDPNKSLKISVEWKNGVIQGQVRTWYPTGEIESQKEIWGNQRNGTCCAWYKNGDLMLMEEYENDELVKGSYFKKGQKRAVSKVEKGEGIATLHDPEGLFLKKISYSKGHPLID